MSAQGDGEYRSTHTNVKYVVSTVGLPRTGKTTYCEHLLTALKDRDIQAIVLCQDNYWDKNKKDVKAANWEARAKLYDVFDAIIKGEIVNEETNAPYDVIIMDGCAPTVYKRRETSFRAKMLGYMQVKTIITIFQHPTGSVEKLKAFALKNVDSIKQSHPCLTQKAAPWVINSIAENYESLTKEEKADCAGLFFNVGQTKLADAVTTTLERMKMFSFAQIQT